MSKLEIAKWIIGIPALLVAIGYLFTTWHHNYDSVNEAISTIEVKTLIIPVLLSLIAGVINAVLWFRINVDLEKKVTFAKSYWAWSVSRAFRYIPGKIFSYYIRNKLQGSSLRTGILASFNEFLLALLPLIILVIIYLILTGEPVWLSTLFFMLFLLLYFIKPVLMSIKILRNIEALPFTSIYNPKGVTKKLIFIIPAMLIHGISLYIIIVFSLNDSYITLIEAIITLYVSGIIGQLALVSPGGIGVREASIVVLLTNFGLSSEVAIASALLSRISLLFAELGNVIFAYIYKELK